MYDMKVKRGKTGIAGLSGMGQWAGKKVSKAQINQN